MLLVYPVTEVVKFIPVLFGTVLVGTSSGNPLWSVIPLIAIVGFALTRWFTTTYRVGPTHVELRTGLVRRRTLSVPRSRIRSVDIEADLLHRILGLAVVVVGTGQQAESGEKFELDALSAQVAPVLRAELLAHTAGGDTAVSHGGIAAPTGAHGREIGHWQPGWVRYAPLSLTGFAVIAPLLALPFQFGLSELSIDADTPRWVENNVVLVIGLAVLMFLLAVVVVVSIAACGRYLATYFGLRVVDDGRTLHLSHGLFTTRQITLDLARFRGATINEPLLLRRAGAAELEAIMVGENPRQKILPQAPRAAVERTLGELLGSRQLASAKNTAARPAKSRTDPVASEALPSGAAIPARPDAPHHLDTPTATTGSTVAEHSSRTDDSAATDEQAGPEATARAEVDASAHLSAPLTPHGPVARRRRWVRAVLPACVPAVVLAVLTISAQSYPPWLWLPVVVLIAPAVLLAEDRYRGLGHTVLPGTAHGPAWLITRSGSLDRDRDCLEAPGIIGWTVRQTFWQRRSGIATVVAATAAGKKSYRIVDVPLERAWEIIEDATPGALGHR
ncbi:PH domain-containing protein [Nocardia higoensis]|uniref:PH domain-containing protein n=2 Tax=Nocardia higoensis TaxID=228599 RepID=A0ABS0DBX2_9NOCA|nr:PH domain-containing protein [Nocardia higoensis]